MVRQPVGAHFAPVPETTKSPFFDASAWWGVIALALFAVGIFTGMWFNEPSSNCKYTYDESGYILESACS